MLRLFALLLLCTLGFSAQAVTVEAEGRALIYNRDLDSARQQAINQAAQQALLQAGAFVSSRQRVKDGILMTDHLQVQMQGHLDNVRVLSEKVENDQLLVLIRAEVLTDESCAASFAGRRYAKSVAIAGFPLAQPAQAALGGLQQAATQLSAELSNRIGALRNLRPLNAAQINLHPQGQNQGSYQNSRGGISNALPVFKDLEVQFIVSGVVRDLSLYQPDRDNEGNVLRVWYDQLDYRGSEHLRNFAVELFIHDGFTGALLFNRSYRVGGLWLTDRHARTGFMTPAFLATDYGQKVNTLLGTLAQDVDEAIQCEPFSTRILSTEGNRITFNAGSVIGVRPGDSLRVYRRSTQFDPRNQPHVRLEDTHASLVVNEVHPLFASGNLSQPAAELNVQQDDILMAR
ncbi:MAG TPA: flagellar assembly protein T N-terminal domain-containing protein [Motiliproteus sp.]